MFAGDGADSRRLTQDVARATTELFFKTGIQDTNKKEQQEMQADIDRKTRNS